MPEPAALRLSRIKGNSASCVLLCVYGNRAYEDTLVEMQDIARECGFRVVAAVVRCGGAFHHASVCHRQTG